MTILGHFGTHRVPTYYCGLCPREKATFPTPDAKAEHLRQVHGAQVLKMYDGTYRYTWEQER